jgi:carbamoyl-phosphate synthase large subunit
LKDITAVLTCAGSSVSQGMIQSLRFQKERSIRIIGTDVKELNAGKYLVDRFHKVPHGSSPEYVGAMLDVARKEDCDIILPCSDYESLSLSKNLERFEKLGVKVATSRNKSIRTSIDKGLFYQFLRKNGLPFPNFYLPQSASALEDAASKLGYPDKMIVVKPRVATGTRGFRILTEGADARDVLLNEKPESQIMLSLKEFVSVFSRGHFPSLVVSEYLTGREYSVDALARNGRTMYVVPKRRIERASGPSLISVVEENSAVAEVVRKVIEALGFDYNVNVQLKYSESGVPVPFEANPRIAGSIASCTAAGVNLLYYAVKLALGEEVPTKRVKYGTMMVRHLQETFIYHGEAFQFPDPLRN